MQTQFFELAPSSVFGLSVITVMAIVWTVSQVQKRRRSRAVYESLANSMRGELSSQARRGFIRFNAAIEPPPDPFVKLAVGFEPASWLDPVDWYRRITARPTDRLIIRGAVSSQVTAELVWQRRRLPARATGVGSDREIWVQHRLDFLNTVYATRGANVSAVQHEFADLQRRYGIALNKIFLQADIRPELEIEIRDSGINVEDIPALLASVRSLGRAAVS